MAHAHFCRMLGKTKLGNRLVDRNNEANRRDEAAQERLAENTVEEAQAGETRKKDSSTSHTRHDTTDLSLDLCIVLVALVMVDAASHHRPDQQRTSSFRANHHLRRAAENGVYEWVEDEGIQAIDRRDMCEVVGEGQSHR